MATLNATTLSATAPSPENQDQALPDPSGSARWILLIGLAVALVVAIVFNAQGWTGTGYAPPTGGNISFSIFAALYVAAQVLERLMELVVPMLPVPIPKTGSEEVKVAQVKADRAKWALAITTVAGVVISCVFGLFFLEVVGIHEGSNTVDSFATGLLIGAGTKPLHDFITLLQNRDAPTTGTTVS